MESPVCEREKEKATWSAGQNVYSLGAFQPQGSFKVTLQLPFRDYFQWSDLGLRTNSLTTSERGRKGTQVCLLPVLVKNHFSDGIIAWNWISGSPQSSKCWRLSNSTLLLGTHQFLSHYTVFFPNSNTSHTFLSFSFFLKSWLKTYNLFKFFWLCSVQNLSSSMRKLNWGPSAAWWEHRVFNTGPRAKSHTFHLEWCLCVFIPVKTETTL